MDLNDCQCPGCQNFSLKIILGLEPDPLKVYDKAIHCEGCGAFYDIIWGIPYLGYFEEADLFSLFEIAANAGDYQPGESANTLKRPDMEVMYRMLHEYHLCGAKTGYHGPGNEDPTRWYWWTNRYNSYVMQRALTAPLSLKGRHLLDAGAGTGFDSFFFVLAGARVTALDFDPHLASHGRLFLPEVRWIGGSSHALPFRDGSFEVVAVNSAFHHMRDLPRSMAEMLRVLQPGGYLLSFGDSFRPNTSNEQYEVKVFNESIPVLKGINEGIPRCRDFLDTLVEFRRHLDIEIFTHQAFGVSNYYKEAINLAYHKLWNLDQALEFLSGASGAIAFRIRLRSPVAGKRGPFPKPIFPCGEFVQSLSNQARALAKLANKIPTSYINLPLLGHHHGKFQLMNGWQSPTAGVNYRTVFSRARRFFRRQEKQTYFNLEVLAKHIPQTDKPQLIIFIDGQPIWQHFLCRGLWTRMALDVQDLPFGETKVFEVRLITPLKDNEAKFFQVRCMALEEKPLAEQHTIQDLDHFGLAALAELGFLDQDRVRVVLPADFHLGIEIINRLRELGYDVDAVVCSGMESFFAHEPGVRIQATYVDPILSGKPADLPGPVRLIGSKIPENEIGVTLNQQGQEPCFLIYPGGSVQHDSGTVVTTQAIRLWRGWKQKLRPIYQLVRGSVKRGVNLVRRSA